MEKVQEYKASLSRDIKIKGQILTTTNYDQFKRLDSNRDISERNYKKLVQSLGKKNVYGGSTILVKEHTDGYYYIYEGQHRFEALKSLKQPIDFVINQDLSEDDVSLMNTTSEVWKLKDFLKQYLHNQNNPSYEYINKLIKEFGTEMDDDSVRAITFTDILYITTKWTPGVEKDFKNGTLKVTEEDYIKAKEKCTMLQTFLDKDVMPLNIDARKYLRAILEFVKEVDGWDKNSDTKILKDKISLYRVMMDYKNYGRTDMYKKLFVEIYNKGQKKRFVGITTIGKEVEYFIVNK